MPFVDSEETHEELKQAAGKEFSDWVVGSLLNVSEEDREEVYKRLSVEEAKVLEMPGARTARPH